jgi:hypothetical protein
MVGTESEAIRDPSDQPLPKEKGPLQHARKYKLELEI